MDGVPVAASCGHGEVRLWDLRTFVLLETLSLPDLRALALTSADGLIVGFHHDIALYRRIGIEP